MYHVKQRWLGAMIRLLDKGSPPISLPQPPLNASLHYYPRNVRMKFNLHT